MHNLKNTTEIVTNIEKIIITLGRPYFIEFFIQNNLGLTNQVVDSNIVKIKYPIKISMQALFMIFTIFMTA